MFARIPPRAMGVSLARKLDRDPEARPWSAPEGKAKVNLKESNSATIRLERGNKNAMINLQ